MYRKLLISLGTIAAGMAWSGGYAHATDPVQGVATSQPFEIAQSSGSGGSTGGRDHAAAVQAAERRVAAQAPGCQAAGTPVARQAAIPVAGT